MATAPDPMIKLTLVFGECEHDGDIEEYLGFISNPGRSSLAQPGRDYGPRIRFRAERFVGGVGYERGVALVELAETDVTAFLALAQETGFLDSYRTGDSYRETIDEIEYEHECDEEEDCDDY